MRAFIFSLDSFVAFTLALIAIYSLIFFSSVPSSYYYLLTQGHYLSRDVLMALSTTECSSHYSSCGTGDVSILDHIVSEDDPDIRKNLIENTVGESIPKQFGYIVEMSSNQGNSWAVLYDAAEDSNTHAKIRKKLTVSSQVIAFDYSNKGGKLKHSPYNYLTCGRLAYAGVGAELGDEDYAFDESGGYADWGIATCGEWFMESGTGSDSEDVSSIALGNVHPDILLGELVPSSDVAIVRLTVYI